MARASNRQGPAGRSAEPRPAPKRRAGARGASGSAASEPVEVEARSELVRIPGHPIYGEDAQDPGTRLLADLVEIGESDSVLVVGGGSGLVPVVAARLARRGNVVVHCDQLPEANQVEEALRLGRIRNARVVRSARLSDLRGEQFDVALLGTSFEPSRETLNRRIREAALLLRPGGHLYLHGGKREGIESAAPVLREALGSVVTLSYRKGHRVLVAERGESVRAEWSEDPLDVAAVSVGGEELQIETRTGIFAGGELDEGTRLLLESLVVGRGDVALDLGCGSGIVGLFVARRAPEGRVYMVDSDLRAVELAERNVARNGVTNAEVRASDSYSALADLRFDLIATNPPFHVGRVQSAAIVERFVSEAPAHLNPGGRLCLVANRFLRYESLFPDAFGPVEVLAQTSRFRVLSAALAAP